MFCAAFSSRSCFWFLARKLLFIIYIVLFGHCGTRVYPSLLSMAELHLSHELPQTHLQKIHREIVWLLHHCDHLPSLIYPLLHYPPTHVTLMLL